VFKQRCGWDKQSRPLIHRSLTMFGGPACSQLKCGNRVPLGRKRLVDRCVRHSIVFFDAAQKKTSVGDSKAEANQTGLAFM